MRGKTADSIVVDEPIEGGPVNSDGGYWGEMTVRDAVKFSKNTIAWKIYQEITPRAGAAYLLNMDFKKVWYDKDYTAAPVPSGSTTASRIPVIILLAFES